MIDRYRGWMKRTLGPVLILALIGQGFFINYIQTPWIAFSWGHADPSIFTTLKYVFIATSYVCIAACIWIEKSDLSVFHIDRIAIVALILSSFFLFRARLGLSDESYFLFVISLAGLWIFVATLRSWTSIPTTRWRWVGIGIFVTGILVIAVAMISILIFHNSSSFRLDSVYHATIFVVSALSYHLSFNSITEEFVFRGFLWGYLTRRGWTDRNAMIFQGLLFWLIHPNIFVDPPIYALILFPASIAIESILVRYSRQLFPSIVSHTLYNLIATLY